MNRIADVRREAGKSQLALVSQLGWSQGRLSNYEAGRRMPSLVDCRAIVRALNELGATCTLDDVFPPGVVTSEAAA